MRTAGELRGVRDTGELKGLRMAGDLRKPLFAPASDLCLTCGKRLDDGQNHTRCRGAA